MKMIENFINNFKSVNREEVEESFLYGNCYWFARILSIRFDGTICYMPINNHFIFRDNSNGEYYDIRGLLSEDMLDEEVDNWEDYKVIEPTGSKRIIRDCINKVDDEFIDNSSYKIY